MSHTQSQQQSADPASFVEKNDDLDEGMPDFETEAAISGAGLAPTEVHLSAEVTADLMGLRLDQVAAMVFADYSRERLKLWIQEGALRVDGKAVKPKHRCNGGETLTLDATLQTQTHSQPEAMDLDVVYQDDDLIVINKPVGMVVHPAAGNWSGTLVNGLLHFDPRLAELPRAGLVHRIDKDTSGLLVVARNLQAQHHLAAQLEEKSVYRVYDAVVVGHVIAGGTVDQPIRRHSVDRLKMAVQMGGRPSVTHYRVAERFGTHTLLRVQLETGRTHQIRVHMSHVGLPLVGDSVYGGRLRLPRGISPKLSNTLQQFKRQALHARELGLIHPRTGKEMHFEAPWPEDFAHLVEVLRQSLREDEA